MDHFGNPRNGGVPSRYNAKGMAGSPASGPFMVLYLFVANGVIESTGFQTFGCAPAIAAGSYLSEKIRGLKVHEAAAIDFRQLMDELGGLPLGKEHCAQIAVAALGDAIRQVEPGMALS
jgi:NifU-like protein involved in Fe-S cluster formation